MAIDLNEILKRLQLRALTDRITTTEEALDIAQGLWLPDDDLLLPKPANAARQKAWDRAKRQMQSLGPRIMETKMNSILGDVTWGGDSQALDARLEDVDLRSLAARLLPPYLVTGVMAGLAHTIPGDTTPRITRLGGYLEPYTHPDDVDLITGLYQAWQTTREVTTGSMYADQSNAFGDGAQVRRYLSRWTVRVWDWSDGPTVMREWTNLKDPSFLGMNPDVLENAPTPRFRVRRMSHDGLPLGEVMSATPQLKALWATEARLLLSEELAAFPQLKVKGEWDDGNVIGPGEPLVVDKDGDAEWMSPGALDELRQQKGSRSERVRDDLSLPGGFLGGQTPSGEAFKEANIRFRQNAEGYARDGSGLLTELVDDYAALVGAKPVPVSISPSKSYDEAARVQTIINLYDKNLLPLQVAANELQPFFPTWSDSELQLWVDAQTARVSVADFNNLTASGGP